LERKTILLFAEQGFGDTIQFVRYAPVLAARGALVLLLVQPALVSMLARIEGIKGVFGFEQDLPHFDRQFPLMSLPLVLGGSPENPAIRFPYLVPGRRAASEWRARLAQLPGLKVGIVWAGHTWPGAPRLNRRRSLQFHQLSGLAGVNGVSFISLQKGPAVTPLPSAANNGLKLHDWTAELNHFDDTAGLVQNLDLVISVDTAVAHLAGALGRPTWLLNRFDSCWRWLHDRDDSPWYPTLRQFRQAAPGDWDAVLRRVRDELQVVADAASLQAGHATEPDDLRAGRT
jgi:hypothetical protein